MIPQMKSDVKKNIPLMEFGVIIEKRAGQIGLTNNKLISNYVQIPESIISRFFNYGRISGINLFKLQEKFNLLDIENNKSKEILDLYKQLSKANEKLVDAMEKINRLEKQLYKDRRRDDPADLNVIDMRKKMPSK